MVDQKFRVDAEHAVEKLFIIIILIAAERTAGNVSHREQSRGLQLSAVAVPDAPEIGQRPVIPQKVAVAHLVELRNPRAAPIRFDMFCHDVHRHFAQIEVGADAGGCGNAGAQKHIQQDGGCQLLRSHAVGFQIAGHVHEDLVDGVHMDILRRHVF